MQPCFHLLDILAFCACIPGTAPTEVERNEFKPPNLERGMLERDLYSELDTVIQSVFKAAQCKKLHFLNIASHKINDSNHGKPQTFKGTGIYRPAPFTCMTNDLDSNKGSKDSEKLKTGCLVDRSCFWVDVPIIVNNDENDSLFCFKTKPQGLQAESKPQTAEVDQEAEAAQAGEPEEDGEEEEEEEEEEDEEDVETKQYNRWHIIDDFDDDIEDVEAVEDDEDLKSQDMDEDDVPEGERPTTVTVPVTDIVNKPIPPFTKLSDNGEKTLDQFVEYHLNVFKYQHRTFCYSIYVYFDMARLLYLDRAGAYITGPFSWVEPASPLHEFVWKLAKQANDDKLGNMGHDTTAEVVSLGARRKFLKEAQNPALAAHIRAGLKKAAADDCPLYELTVEDVPPSPEEWFPDEPFPKPSSPRPSPSGSSSGDDSTSNPAEGSTATIRHFIVGQPHFSANTLVGRCTRGYMAFDVTDPNKWVPCFLKDSWRPLSPRHTRPEHLVYERLKRMNVKPTDGIATLVCGGDVDGPRAQWTRVQKDLPNRPVRRIHYRLVTADIGLPLSEFENFSELSVVFVDVLRAHRKAWDLAGILHRDISVGNIMIRVDDDGKRSGLLIDWELSRLQCELPEGPSPVEPVRAGTWQFRSALSLRYPRKPYQRSDDIESFVHAYLYLVLRYHLTSVYNLKNKVLSLFESVSLNNGIEIGGYYKLMMLSTGRSCFMVTRNKYLQQLLDAILDNCRRAYSEINYDEMERLYDPEPETVQAGPSTQHGLPRRVPGSRKRPSILRPSDDAAPSAEEVHSDDDPSPRRRRRRRWGPDAQPAAPTGPGKIGVFLENPIWLMELFAEHAEETYEFDDKAPDQFIAQGVFQPSSDSCATSKRRRCDDESDEDDVDEEDDEREGLEVRCRKRAKGLTGKTSSAKGTN